MPIYEYRCEACGHEFEELQKISEAPVTSCQKCQAEQVHRLISKTSFQLKGGGWYSDLYGSASASSKKSSASKSNSSTSSKASSSDTSSSKASSSGGSSNATSS